VREIHDDSLTADHEHSRSTLTLMVPVPPPPATVRPVPERVTAHRADEGPVTLVDVDRHPASKTKATIPQSREDQRKARGMEPASL
jgi:hypothetical protein